MALLPDRIILAPGDHHLTLEKVGKGAVVRLLGGRSASGCMPSVDPMFGAVAAVYGPAAMGVVLTGMGRDGVEGAARLVACGGTMIAQDEASSAVWGMPRAVFDAGLASALLSPDKIARRIAARTEEPFDQIGEQRQQDAVPHGHRKNRQHQHGHRAQGHSCGRRAPCHRSYLPWPSIG